MERIGITMNFNEMIHQERTRMLGLLPKNGDIFLSAGCSGTWYFKWIEENYGPVRRHIGIELYSPKPNDLPNYVEWIQNSVSDMIDVASGTVDILFSGQNIEHLFSADMKGFFYEANRVLREGGTLCIDSPNRDITLPGRYAQPEHVLELNVTEAVELIVSAGFEVEAVYGIWRCRSDSFQRWAIQSTDDSLQFHARLQEAKNKPNDSFIWWIMARKTGKPSPHLAMRVDELFLKSYPGVVRSRFFLASGIMKNVCGTEVLVEIHTNHSGWIFYGPYIPLPPGKYIAEFLFKPLASQGRILFDVVSALGTLIHARDELAMDNSREWKIIRLLFSLDKYTNGIETRAFSHAANAVLRFGSQIIPYQ